MLKATLPMPTAVPYMHPLFSCLTSKMFPIFRDILSVVDFFLMNINQSECSRDSHDLSLLSQRRTLTLPSLFPLGSLSGQQVK